MGQDHDTGFGEQGAQAQAALVDRKPHVADVGAPLAYHLGLVVPRRSDDTDGQVGVPVGDRASLGGDDDAGHERDGERRSAVRGTLHPPVQCLGGGEQRTSVGQELAAGLGQHGGATIPDEELRAEFVLEGPDLA